MPKQTKEMKLAGRGAQRRTPVNFRKIKNKNSTPGFNLTQASLTTGKEKRAQEGAEQGGTSKKLQG